MPLQDLFPLERPLCGWPEAPALLHLFPEAFLPFGKSALWALSPGFSFLPEACFSNQAKESARVHTFPTTMMAGVSTPWRFTSASSVPTVATIRFCPAVVPFCRMAAGISASIPAPISPWQISGKGADTHQKDQSSFGPHQGLKVNIVGFSLALVAGNDVNRRTEIPVGNRNSIVCRHCNG